MCKALGDSLRTWAFSLREAGSQGRVFSRGVTRSDLGFPRTPVGLRVDYRSQEGKQRATVIIQEMDDGDSDQPGG